MTVEPVSDGVRRDAPERWLVFNSRPGEPAFNMAFDEALLEAVSRYGRPALRLYSWTVPAATFGYSQRYADAEQLTSLRPLIRRPTGGGVVPHDGDWTYTLVFPPGHWWYASRARGSYQRLHAWLQASFHGIGLQTQLALTVAVGAPTHCFLRPEQFDVLWEGVKIAGAAQRRTRSGLLIQGSIQPPSGANRDFWEKTLLEIASAHWGVIWSPADAGEDLADRAQRLAREKYLLPKFNQRR